MPDANDPTLQLLSTLLGKRTAKRVYRGSLSDLFLDEDVPEDVKARLRASRELVQRWMLEDMRRQPVLTNPTAVRDYLAVHYAGHEREVFGCLFLDNRHRLIALEEMFRGTVDGTPVPSNAPTPPRRQSADHSAVPRPSAAAPHESCARTTSLAPPSTSPGNAPKRSR